MDESAVLGLPVHNCTYGSGFGVFGIYEWGLLWLGIGAAKILKLSGDAIARNT